MRNKRYFVVCSLVTEVKEELHLDIQKIIAGMTLEEKISLCTGGDFWHTKEMP